MRPVNESQIQAKIREFNTHLRKAGTLLAKTEADLSIKRVKEEIKRIRLRKSNELYDSIGNPAKGGIYEVSSKGYRITVGTTVPQGIIHEYGISSSWVIEPKSKKWLKFYWPKAGKNIYVKKVVHPPLPGKYFMLRGSLRAHEEMVQIAPRILKAGGIV